MSNHKLQQPEHPSIISFAGDLPNICSLAGLLCAILGIYYAVLGNFPVAIIGALWAIFFDWTDGIIARNMTGRTDYHRAVGVQLDSLIDIVSFGVFPAVFLLSYGQFNPWFLPGAFLIIAACAIRLSYFNVFGMIDDKTYVGLAVDNNNIIIAFVFLFESLVEHTVFSIILYAILMIIIAFNVASVRTPKFTGKNWYILLTIYCLVMTVIYGWIQWNVV